MPLFSEAKVYLVLMFTLPPTALVWDQNKYVPAAGADFASINVRRDLFSSAESHYAGEGDEETAMTHGEVTLNAGRACKTKSADRPIYAGSSAFYLCAVIVW